MGSVKTGRTLVGILIVGAVPSAAMAGNDDGIAVGNEAALLGNAAVANVADSSAAFYNPAALGAVTSTTADLSASAFQFRHYQSPDLVVSGDQVDADSTSEFVSVPSALAFARPLGDDVRIGIGVFVPQSQDLILELDAERTVGGASGQIGIALSGETDRYQGVIALAWRPIQRLWLGASLRASFTSTSGFARFGALQEAGTLSALAASNTELSQQIVGMSVAAGVHWTPVDWLIVGATVTAPEVAVAGRTATTLTIATGAIGLGADELTLSTERDGGFEFGFDAVRAAVVRAGAAFQWEGGKVVIDGEIHPAISNREFEVDRAAFWNLRVGGELRVAESLWLGGGLFTDRAPERGLDGFASSTVNFYGGTAGVRWSSRYQLDETEDGDSIGFGTTFAVRYSYGSGQIGGLSLDVGEDPFLNDRVADLEVHEFGVHLGSTVTF